MKPLQTDQFQVQVVWNREFHWCDTGVPITGFDKARRVAKDLMESGDGARVKKAQVVNLRTGEATRV